MKSYEMAVTHKKYNFKTKPFDHQRKILKRRGASHTTLFHGDGHRQIEDCY